MGAAVGLQGIPQRFIDGLHDGKAIAGEIDAYMHALYDDAAQAPGAAAGSGAGEEL